MEIKRWNMVNLQPANQYIYNSEHQSKPRSDKQVYAWQRLKYLGWLCRLPSKTNFQFVGVISDEERLLIEQIERQTWRLRTIWRETSEKGGMKFKPKKPEPEIISESLPQSIIDLL